MDRIYFVYNHFQDALKAGPTVPEIDRSFAIDRYTLGFEKTFFEGSWSVEGRMPFAGSIQFDSARFDIGGGSIGNLAVALKRLLYADQNSSAIVGVGFDLPTGEDATVLHGAILDDDTRLRIHNEAFHVSPFAGLMQTSADKLTFAHGFLQLDFATAGNTVDGERLDPFAPFFTSATGVLNEQTLLHLDASVGHWLHRRECCGCATSLAALLELHYTTTLQDTDRVELIASGAGTISYALQNLSNRVDSFNLTTGLHAQFPSRWNLRVAASLPLRNRGDRQFSSELQVSLNKDF